MAIVITNGTFYITVGNNAFCKTPNISEAQKFFSVNRAVRKMRKHPNKFVGYYLYDTTESVYRNPIPQMKQKENGRIRYSEEERRRLYNDADGKCALCGKKVSYKAIHLDHIVPLGADGTDTLDNLQVCCPSCDTIKREWPEDKLQQKAKDLYLHHMDKLHGSDPRWNLIRKQIEELEG